MVMRETQSLRIGCCQLQTRREKGRSLSRQICCILMDSGKYWSVYYGENKKIFQVVKYQILLKSQQPKEFLDIFIYVHNCTLPIFTPYDYASSPIPLPLLFPQSPLPPSMQTNTYLHICSKYENMQYLSFLFPSSYLLSSFLQPFLKTSSSPLTSLFVSIFISHLCIKSEFCTWE